VHLTFGTLHNPKCFPCLSLFLIKRCGIHPEQATPAATDFKNGLSTQGNLSWSMPDGEMLSYPKADSRQLPPRIDFTETEYLGLVDPDSAGSVGAGEAYSVEVMETAVSQAIVNQGALGMYCNALMLNKALYGRLPDNPPALLEDIIDSAVKTGADLSQVVSWNYANSREILENRIPIPSILHQRLSVDWSDRENRSPLPRTSGVTGHDADWLDNLEAGVQAHIQAMQEKRGKLAAQARPLQAVLDAGLNKAYTAALGLGKGKHVNVLERPRVTAEDYLAHFPQNGAG
jgi:hypothetical protein